MSKSLRSIGLCLAIAFLAALVLTGCREPGPAEEAGQEIDEVVEDAGEALDELGEETDQLLEDIEEEAEDRID